MDQAKTPNTNSKNKTIGSQDSLIPKPHLRKELSDRITARLKKSNLRPPAARTKLSFGQQTSESSAVTPISKICYTHVIEKATRPSSAVKSKSKSTYVETSDLTARGLITPKAIKSKNINLSSGGKSMRISCAERVNVFVSKGPKKDNRPLSDKSYQNVMLNNIDRYFVCIQQTHILNSNGSVKPLSLKIFIDATSILIKLLDVRHVTLNTANYMQEIPKIAKKLHYPGLTNKSWLKTANAMHSYPQAIGWLCWLVELCEVNDLASKIFTLERLPMTGKTDLDKENYKKTFSAMIQCYKAWNNEKPDEEENIFQQFVHEETIRRGIDEKTSQKIQLELEKAQDKLQKEETEKSEIDSEVIHLEKSLSNMRKDKIEQQTFILEQEKKIEKILKEIKELKKDSKIFVKDIEELEKNKEELKATINKQSMTAIERDKIIETCTEKQSYIQNFENLLEDMNKKSYLLDTELVSTNSSLVKAVLAFNQSLFIQFSGSNENFDDLLIPEVGICEPGFIDKLKNKEAHLAMFFQKKSKELIKKKSIVESHERELEEAVLNRDILSEKLQKKKALEDKDKYDLKTKENNKREEIKKLQSAINQLNELILKTSNETSVLAHQLEDTFNRKQSVLQKNSCLQESAKKMFVQIDNILDNHRIEIENLLKIYFKHQTQ